MQRSPRNNQIQSDGTYGYLDDAFDRRVVKQVDADGDSDFDSAEAYVYDGAHVALRFVDSDGDGAADSSLANRYVHGPVIDQVLADEQVHWDAIGEDYVTDDLYWPLADHLGSVRDVAEYNPGTDTTTVANHLTIDSFGRITAETNSAVDHLFAYTGRERDDDAGLHYYRARWYDPSVGQFVSQDPIGFRAQDFNLQRLARNNVVRYSDPTGLDPGAGIYGDTPWKAPDNSVDEGTFMTIAPTEYGFSEAEATHFTPEALAVLEAYRSYHGANIRLEAFRNSHNRQATYGLLADANYAGKVLDAALANLTRNNILRRCPSPNPQTADLRRRMQSEALHYRFLFRATFVARQQVIRDSLRSPQVDFINGTAASSPDELRNYIVEHQKTIKYGLPPMQYSGPNVGQGAPFAITAQQIAEGTALNSNEKADGLSRPNLHTSIFTIEHSQLFIPAEWLPPDMVASQPDFEHYRIPMRGEYADDPDPHIVKLRQVLDAAEIPMKRNDRIVGGALELGSAGPLRANAMAQATSYVLYRTYKGYNYPGRMTGDYFVLIGPRGGYVGWKGVRRSCPEQNTYWFYLGAEDVLKEWLDLDASVLKQIERNTYGNKKDE